MLTYIIRRLFLMVPTLVGVTAVVFFVMALAPGGFGGTVLNQQGAQSEGDEARRIRQYFNRRYGLDKPVLVQYGRWLNQVSPIGFLNSSDLKFTALQKNKAASQYENSLQLKKIRRPKHALQLANELAAYDDSTPQKAIVKIEKMLTDLPQGLVQLKKIEKDLGTFDQTFSQALKTNQHHAAVLLYSRFAEAIAGRDRIHFQHLIFKWPNLGESLRGRPVTKLLAEAVPITLLLNFLTLPLTYLVAIGVGILAAKHRGKLFDVASGTTMLVLWSVPALWVGVMLIGFLANKQYYQWFPAAGLHDLRADEMAFLPAFGQVGFERGWLLDMVWHLILPVFCLTYGSFAVLAKLTRGAVLENISADYARTARAKGVSDHDVLYRHVFRNSLLPLITVASSILPALFVGSVIIENIFSLPGMGKLGVEAAFMKDRELVMGTTLIGGMIGLFSELLRDVCYAVSDPRVNYE